MHAASHPRAPGDRAIGRPRHTPRLAPILLRSLAAGPTAGCSPRGRGRAPAPAGDSAPARSPASRTRPTFRAALKPAPPHPPAQVDELLSPDTSRKEVEMLWGALRACYGTESEAVAAAARNTGTILPYLNSPSNIKGCYAVLVELLGSEQAAEVCAKNPGILQCNPRVLAP